MLLGSRSFFHHFKKSEEWLSRLPCVEWNHGAPIPTKAANHVRDERSIGLTVWDFRPSVLQMEHYATSKRKYTSDSSSSGHASAHRSRLNVYQEGGKNTHAGLPQRWFHSRHAYGGQALILSILYIGNSAKGLACICTKDFFHC